MKLLSKITFALLLVVLSACAENSKMDSGAVVESDSSSAGQVGKRKQAAKYLAYIHDLVVELERPQLLENYKKILQECEADQKYQCVIVSSKLTNGDYSSSSISLRVLHQGVDYFSSLAGSGGKVSARASRAEDLGDQIIDSQKRIEMLQSYRDKLEAIESRPDIDIESLLKVAPELAQVQSNIEYAQCEKAKLMQRVEADVLNITLSTRNEQSFISPIADSLSGFGEELSWGFATVIDSAAYVVPWTIFLLLMFLGLRWIFRRLRKKQ